MSLNQKLEMALGQFFGFTNMLIFKKIHYKEYKYWSEIKMKTMKNEVDSVEK